MELKPSQIQKFIELHKDCAGFEMYTEDQKRELAISVANVYKTRFKIFLRIKKDDSKTDCLQGVISRDIPQNLI